MKRTLKCVKFELSSLLTSTLIFLGFYLVINLFVLLIMGLSAGKSQTVSENFVFSAVIFLFISINVVYKSQYNNLMMFGNTRKTIIITKFGTIALVTAGYAVISLLTEYMNVFISNQLHFKILDGLSLIYGSGINDGEKLLWFFALLLFSTGIALLYSTLNYKFGKAFKLVFWGAIGLMSVFSSLLSIASVRSALLRWLKLFFSYGMENGIILSALNMLVIALVLGGFSYLIARRQPQNA